MTVDALIIRSKLTLIILIEPLVALLVACDDTIGLGEDVSSWRMTHLIVWCGSEGDIGRTLIEGTHILAFAIATLSMVTDVYVPL